MPDDILFDNNSSDCSHSYLLYRNDASKMFKEYFEGCWSIARSYVEPNFKRHYQYDNDKFFSLSWELILIKKLIDTGFELLQVQDGYPDICIKDKSGKKIWIECYFPEKGDPTKPDSIPERTVVEGADIYMFYKDASILRITSGLKSKMEKQYSNWLKKGIIESNHIFIIAINGYKLDLSLSSNIYPDVAGAFYPFGSMAVEFFPEYPEKCNWFITTQESIIKENGEEIKKNMFMSEKYSGLHGVLYSIEWPEYFCGDPIKYSYIPNIRSKNAEYKLDVSSFSQMVNITETETSLNVKID